MRKYEISIWEDYLVFRCEVSKNGQTEIKDIPISEWDFVDTSYTYKIVAQWYDERCIAIIGSHEMSTASQAQNPSFIRRVNGEFELTFDLYRQYFDETTLEFIENPFIKYLINERKVKLHLIDQDKWFDLIVKDIQEDSEQKKFTYTARALFINELSKNGLELVFNTELENNTGDIIYLANQVVDGTDWQIVKGDPIRQTTIEPLYVLYLEAGKTISATALMGKEFSDKEEIEITRAAVSNPDVCIYAFYSDIVNQNSDLQFLYREDGFYTINTDTQAINNSTNWLLTGVTYNSDTGLPEFAMNRHEVDSVYRGEKYIRNVKSEYELVLSQTVTICDDGSDKEDIRYYTSTEYLEPTMVTTLVTNPKEFTSNLGWESDGAETFAPVNYPPIDQNLTGTALITAIENSVLCLKFDLQEGQKILNTGLFDQRMSFSPNGIAAGEEFVLRIRYKSDNGGELSGYVAPYTREDDVISFDPLNPIFDFGTLDKTGVGKIPEGEEKNWTLKVQGARQEYSYNNMLTNKLGIILEASATDTYYIEQVDFFKHYSHEVPVKNEDGEIIKTQTEIITPDTIPTNDSLIQTQYYYYSKEANKEKKEAEDWIYIYQGPNEQKKYAPVYDNECTKKRSFTASKSNRFNLIQDLCELFECWAEFNIEHEADGRISRDAQGVPSKKIVFKSYIARDNYAGFKYGINTRSIQRNVNSEELVTKIVVEENNNEYAKDGFCTIARAIDNPSGEAFFFDFRHYYNQGLLNYSDLMNDLYLSGENLPWLGYYKNLKLLNNESQQLIEELSAVSISATKLEAYVTTYLTMKDEAVTLLTQKKQEFASYGPSRGLTYDEYKANNYPSNLETEEQKKGFDEDKEVRELVAAIISLEKTLSEATRMYEAYEQSWKDATGTIDAINARLDEIGEQKSDLNEAFYVKYSRFIQEGSWSSEEYMDDNLYYYDAAAALSISASPQVSYTINVVDVSSLPGYEAYVFEPGDKTYIEDTEFFGWVIGANGAKTPVQEEVFVTETKIVLDDPTQDVITIQNYKTKFEDLFQRIATTTAELKFQSGSYAKAASVVTQTGEIEAATLQDSFNKNAFTLSNSGSQTVVWDESGITVTSPNSPNQIVRIINGGIYLTNNFGSTWSAALTGAGINASYINAGQIDTNLIRIMNGAWPTYRWDGNGLSAYRYSLDNSGNITAINYNEYVRFDQYGLYGISIERDWVAGSLEEIKQKANFSLTWDGFKLRSKGEGYVELSSEGDFLLSDGIHNRIQIGKIGKTILEDGTEKIIYGLLLKDGDNKAVLQTADNGELWLKNKLHIDNGLGNKIQLGTLDVPEIENGFNIPAVFNAADKFVVYEDGSILAENGKFKGHIEATSGTFTGTVYAEDGKFTGEIYATGGKIGNMTIGSLVEAAVDNKRVEILSKEGTVLRITNYEISPSVLHLSAITKGIAMEDFDGFSWKKSVDFETWEELTTSGTKDIEYICNFNDFNNFNKLYLKCEINLASTVITSNYLDLTLVRDGKDGLDGTKGYSIEIASTNGLVFRNNEGNTILNCKVYQGTTEITNNPNIAFQWRKGDTILEGENGSTLEVSADEIEADSFQAFYCDVTIEEE